VRTRMASKFRNPDHCARPAQERSARSVPSPPAITESRAARLAPSTASGVKLLPP